MKMQTPATETLKISDVRGQLNTLVNRIYREQTRIVVEKSGIPVAALVSVQDLERLRDLDLRMLERAEVINQMREAFKDVSPEELEREAEKAVAEVRAEMRAERELLAATR